MSGLIALLNRIEINLVAKITPGFIKRYHKQLRLKKLKRNIAKTNPEYIELYNAVMGFVHEQALKQQGLILGEVLSLFVVYQKAIKNGVELEVYYDNVGKLLITDYMPKQDKKSCIKIKDKASILKELLAKNKVNLFVLERFDKHDLNYNIIPRGGPKFDFMLDFFAKTLC